jgi:hypothetical protein
MKDGSFRLNGIVIGIQPGKLGVQVNAESDGRLSLHGYHYAQKEANKQ